MHDLNHNEDRPRGTYEFPFEFHHIDHTHARYGGRIVAGLVVDALMEEVPALAKYVRRYDYVVAHKNLLPDRSFHCRSNPRESLRYADKAF